MQFVVNDRHQFIESIAAPVAPLSQQLCDFLRLIHDAAEPRKFETVFALLSPLKMKEPTRQIMKAKTGKIRVIVLAAAIACAAAKDMNSRDLPHTALATVGGDYRIPLK